VVIWTKVHCHVFYGPWCTKHQTDLKSAAKAWMRIYSTYEPQVKQQPNQSKCIRTQRVEMCFLVSKVRVQRGLWLWSMFLLCNDARNIRRLYSDMVAATMSATLWTTNTSTETSIQQNTNTEKLSAPKYHQSTCVKMSYTKKALRKRELCKISVQLPYNWWMLKST